MKRKVWAIALLFCATSMVGCQRTASPQTTDTQSTEPTQSTGAHYLIEDTPENIISVQIPYIEGMTEEEVDFVQGFIQEKIEAGSGETFDLIRSENDIADKEREYSQYYISLEAQVMHVSENCVSIVFKGLWNLKNSAHPINWFCSVNYSRETLQQIPFSEKYAINRELYLNFADAAEKGIKEEFNGVWPEELGTFSETLCSETAFLEGMKAGKEFFYYVQENAVVISYPVPHALGDHKEVELPHHYLVAVS